MKIVFVSNFFNHHQSALSDALWEKTDGDYLFVETAAMPEERKRLGYPSQERPYLLQLQGNETKVLQKLQEADVVIAGSAPEWLARRRIQSGKLLFRYAERPLRHGLEPLKYLPRWLRWHWRNPGNKPIYLLCASAFTAGDYRKFGLFQEKAYRWGYFPEFRDKNISELMVSKTVTQILWCGRFLELKHPEDALRAAWDLKRQGYRFQLNFIGTGEQESLLNKRVREWELQSCVCFSGPKTPAQVRLAMEKAGIFLLTSDRREGWGTVLNEAMNSGCAVIASHEVGAVPFLVEDGKNGLIYPSGDVSSLREKIRFLLEQPGEQTRLGRAAYETIRDGWTPEIAADRLLELSQILLSGNKNGSLHRSGPCSPAEEMDEGWYP